MRLLVLKAVKVCLILVTIISIAYLMPTPNPVWADVTVVTIKGVVTGPLGTVKVNAEAEASGAAGSLVGSGTDSPINGPPKVSKGYCRFGLSGTLSGSTATLSGIVSFSNVPSFVGTPVTITGDASTGMITFTFGTFGTDTGTGSVVITSL